MWVSTLISVLAVVLLTGVLTPVKAEINCFKCSSRNGSNEACQDPFSPAQSTYVKACKVPKRNHVGEFPANFCVKLTGISTSTGDILVIRDCVLKNMESQCGAFKFQKETLHGCVLTCNFDGCNGSSFLSPSLAAHFITVLIIMSGVCH